jgi:hypothetical protein
VKSKALTPDQKIERIKKALHYAGDYHTWEDVQEGLEGRRFQIFDNSDGCIITEIIQLPGGRYLNAWIAGGRLPGIMKNVPEMEKIARKNDCKQMLAFGRIGWDRVLPKYGWKKIGVVYAKDVSNA